MADTSATIVSKTKAFAKDITKFLTDARLKKEAALKKAGKDPDKILVKVSFELSTGKGSISRTPQAQAESVSKNKSWTCAGAHMVDKARHVKMLYGAPGKKPKTSWDVAGAFGSKEQHFMTKPALQTKWKALMKKHGLKNFKGQDGWGEGDAFHFELADSKVPKSDKRVQACLIHYAKITRIDGKPRNNSFETGHWKTHLKPHIDKAEKEAKKAEEAARLEAVKSFRWSDTVKISHKLLSNANTSVHKAAKPPKPILPPSVVDVGKEKVKRVSVGQAWVWDSLLQSLFEKVGLSPTSGFDVKLSAGLTYESVTFERAAQSYIRNVIPSATLVYNTPVSRLCKMSVAVSGTITLAKSSLKPTGTLTYDITFTTSMDSEKGKVVITIDGPKATAVLKT